MVFLPGVLSRPKTEENAWSFRQLRPVIVPGSILALFPLHDWWSSQGPPKFKICSWVLIYTLLVWTSYAGGVFIVFRGIRKFGKTVFLKVHFSAILGSYTGSNNESPVDVFVKYFFICLSAGGSISCVVMSLISAPAWSHLYERIHKVCLKSN